MIWVQFLTVVVAIVMLLILLGVVATGGDRE